LPLDLSLLEQPGHVLAEELHGSQAFLVLFDLAFAPADAREVDSDPALRHNVLGTVCLFG